ncbi:MAG TPA: HlyD family efflux transporter periplasmic adaptor subunit [Gemmatales bacterium]|nr:HlyD family efflux transporter periplasmic adaptor subunit [Gemmatales bacterium]
MVGLSSSYCGRLTGGLCLLASLTACLPARAWQTNATQAAPGSSHPTVIVAMGLVDVEQGIARLTSQMPGRIVRIEAKENQTYEPGAVLLVVDDSTPKLKLAQAELALKVVEGKVTQAKAGIQIAEAEKRAQGVAIEVAKAREQTYKRRQEDAKTLEIPGETKKALEDAVRDTAFLVKSENEKLLVVESKLQYARTEEAQAKLQVQVYQEQVNEAKKAVDDCVLKAPYKGKVLRVRARLGELTAPVHPEPLIEYCPDALRIIRAEVAQEFAHSVNVGQSCKITDDSRNNSGAWTGRIQRIGDWYSPRRSNLFEPLQMNDVRTLECIVTVDPGGEPLRIGQRMRISIDTASIPTKPADVKTPVETTKK